MASTSEEARIHAAENSTELLTAFNRIPYSLISAEVGVATRETLAELTKICHYYKVYKQGASFNVEGTNGDYVPAKLKYKMAASLINKEARFLFAEPPDIEVKAKGDVGKVTGEAQDALTTINSLVSTVLNENRFEDALIKAAKDCFIGKRVAALVNFNETDGITITFLQSTQFVYKTRIGNPNIIEEFCAFVVARDSIAANDKMIFKKKFRLTDDGVVLLQESMHDGTGALIEEITEEQETLMPMIPVVVFANDGLSGEFDGESEIAMLEEFEGYYSKMSNADTDALRKSMNPTKYTVDMDSRSTKNLSTAAGALWDLGSDQNLDKANPSVGILEPAMNYSDALKISLDRLKTVGYEQVDVPNITQETMVGTITSGKALKAIYWPLIVRCKEKMKMWGPGLRKVVDIIIQGAMVYPKCITQYTNTPIVPVDYEVLVEQNTPLPEDEAEERTLDLAEVESGTMSRKTYMKRWRKMTDDAADAELQQIALERQIIEDSSFVSTGKNPQYSIGAPEQPEQDDVQENDFTDSNEE